MSRANNNFIANETISIKLPNLDALNDVEGKAQQVTSEVHKIGGLTWQTKVRKMRKPTRLNLFVYCNEAVKDRLWLCKVQLKVKAWVKGEEKPFYKESDTFYGFNGHVWIFPIETYRATWRENNSYEIKLEIKLAQVQEKSFPALDTTLVVNMGESCSETLFVNKHLLASASSYFRNLFFEDWREREHAGNCFTLNEPADFDIRAFKTMINAAMTLGPMLQESNFLDFDLAVEITKLSVKFDFPMLLDCCEQFLSDVKADDYDCRLSAMELLELADQFNLDLLKPHFLKQISISDFVKPTCGCGSMNMKHAKDKEIFSRLSKSTQEELRPELDVKIDFGDVNKSKMEYLELADQLNLTKLKQQCLDEMNVVEYMTNFSGSHAIHNRLNEATQEQLQAKLEVKTDELCELTEKLKKAIKSESNETKSTLVEHINKLAEVVLGPMSESEKEDEDEEEEEEEESSGSDSDRLLYDDIFGF